MKFKSRKRKVKWVLANCGCCEIVHRKGRLNDAQAIKEGLEEINSEFDCRMMSLGS